MVTVKGFFAKSITAKMAVCVVVMLVLSMASIGAVFVMVGAQKTDVRVINEAGRLRMLSQKMTKAALLVASGEETAREELLATAALFEKGLTGLSHGDAELGVPPAPDDVEPQLTLLAQHWTEFHANVRLLAEAASGSAVFNEAAAVVRSENLALLTEANNTVTLFEQEAVGKISHLNRVLMVILALDGIAFVLVLLVVSRSVRPLVELAEVADRVVSGNLAVSVPVDSRDEVGALGRSFNAMVGHLREAHDELERSNAELADFAYVVSHDLKAPLRAVSQLATWISEDYAECLDDKGQEKLNLLIGRIHRMHNLIEGILQYSRIGRVREDEARVNLHTLVQETVETLAPPEHITVTIDEALPSVVGEPARLRQVFQNLLSNAVKYMDKPNGRVRIGCEDEGAHWRISVADNGPGIAETYHHKIFQMFQTLTPRDEFESTGVGLALVKKIVEANGNRVWLESTVGEGSTFYFTLPKSIRTAPSPEPVEANV